jgi:hypothetical protein
MALGQALRLPRTEVHDYTGEQVEGAGLVEFRLLYSGRLLGANRESPRPEVKHALRREFHPQLRRLWNSNHSLDRLARMQQLTPWMQKHPGADLQSFTNAEFRQAGIDSISYQWERAGFNFVPLVTADLCLRCRIDILFLRPEEPRYIMQSGDLDARLKTVFDALRIPGNLGETGRMGPQEDETPFFCLLEDDKLISEVSVTTDELLVLPKERAMNPSDAFLVIHVKLLPAHASQFSSLFD